MRAVRQPGSPETRNLTPELKHRSVEALPARFL